MLFRNVGLLLIKLRDLRSTGDMFDQETTETSSSLRPPLKMVGLLRTLQISTVMPEVQPSEWRPSKAYPGV